MRTTPLLLATALVAVAAPATSRAAPDDVATYAIVIGSNPGGPGQAELRFAADDARRVADVLRELGGYGTGDVELVMQPAPADVLAAIDRIAARASADSAAGRKSIVFFYYSGHARANALNLGARDLPLADLRERLVHLPATLTVVVLDACQSGAFSRVKGAAPAADFSFNSKSKLDASGVAVMASSSASELSQESDLLKSSYFTHHLLVGLRGAGDSNRDGQVSLDEAYRYAYHQTLVATAATAVGTQHVSLEVDLKGQGEVALTYPVRASAQVELPARLIGDVLVEQLPAEAVVAEVHKSAGKPVRIAVAPGDYRVMVRDGRELRRCPVVVRDGGVATVDLARCDRVPMVDAGAKGGAAWGALWQVDLVVGAGNQPDDAFVRGLRDFGYDGDLGAGHVGATALYRIHPMVVVGGEVDWASSGEWSRATTSDTSPQRFWWSSGLVGAVARGEWQRPGATLVPFVQAGAGLAVGLTTYLELQDQRIDETFVGWHLAAAAGATWTPFDHWGFVTRLSWSHAPIIENLIGDTHDAGGVTLHAGVHLQF